MREVISKYVLLRAGILIIADAICVSSYYVSTREYFTEIGTLGVVVSKRVWKWVGISLGIAIALSVIGYIALSWLVIEVA
jgi:hypothetical protein